jgi:hypothetical protein
VIELVRGSCVLCGDHGEAAAVIELAVTRRKLARE